MNISQGIAGQREQADAWEHSDRTKRVKDARSEAQKEIEEYRSKKEEEFKQYEQKVSEIGIFRGMDASSVAFDLEEHMQYGLSRGADRSFSKQVVTRRPRMMRRRTRRSS